MDITKAVYDQPEATDKLSNSGFSYPQTKREALDAKDIGANIKINKNMGANLISYFQSIGADKDLPADKNELVGWINRFHMQVAVNNPLWPEELPFEYIYGAFINAIIYDRVDLKGYNIKAHIKAFKGWITQSGVEDQLIARYNRDNPTEQPKQIEETSKREYLNEDKLLNQSPEEVLHQVNTLAMIHGTFEEAINDVANNGKTYREKLQRTFEHYKSKGHYANT